MIETPFLCRQHFLGEHNEIHKAIGGMRKGRSIKKYLEKNQLAPQLFKKRHAQLEKEFRRRGYQHNSPFPADFQSDQIGYIDVAKNIIELMSRCPECQKLLSTKYVIRNGLVGSRTQVLWADNIRAEKFKLLEKASPWSNEDLFRQLSSLVSNEASAAWWINTRNKSIDQILLNTYNRRKDLFSVNKRIV